MSSFYSPEVVARIRQEQVRDYLNQCDWGCWYDDFNGETCHEPVKIVFKDAGTFSLQSEEDNGKALIGSHSCDEQSEGLFVKIQSWSEGNGGPDHRQFRSLLGRKLRITIETID